MIIITTDVPFIANRISDLWLILNNTSYTFSTPATNKSHHLILFNLTNRILVKQKGLRRRLRATATATWKSQPQSQKLSHEIVWNVAIALQSLSGNGPLLITFSATGAFHFGQRFGIFFNSTHILRTERNEMIKCARTTHLYSCFFCFVLISYSNSFDHKRTSNQTWF